MQGWFARRLNLLLVLGLIIAVVGLATGSYGVLALGAVVAIVAALGEHATELGLKLPFGTELTLKREPVEEQITSHAVENGVNEQRAREIAHEIAERIVPPEGARIIVSKTGGASAKLRGGGTVTAQVAPGQDADQALAKAVAEDTLLLCERCGFHVFANTVGIKEGQSCPQCGLGWVERL